MRRDIHEVAKGRWQAILARLGVDQQRLVNRKGPCPLGCGGEESFRFDDKEGRGTWICTHCGAGNGMDFAIRHTGRSFRELADEIRGMELPEARINGSSPDIDQRRRRLYEVQAALRPLGGTPAERYLHRRGIATPGSGWPNLLRFHPSMEYWDSSGDTPRLVGRFPAMVAPFVKNGRLLSYHITYLSDDGRKADLSPARKVLPPLDRMKGGAIMLSNAKPGHVVVSEGIETGLAFAELQGVPAEHVVPCYAAGMLEEWQCPGHVEGVIVAGDTDESFEGQAAAFVLARRLRRAQKEVRVELSPMMGRDWLDILVEMRA